MYSEKCSHGGHIYIPADVAGADLFPRILRRRNFLQEIDQRRCRNVAGIRVTRVVENQPSPSATRAENIGAATTELGAEFEIVFSVGQRSVVDHLVGSVGAVKSGQLEFPPIANSDPMSIDGRPNSRESVTPVFKP